MSMPYTSPASAARPARVTVPALAAMAREGNRIAMLTAYDASLAAVCDRAGVDVVLVGDSLGMVIQGRDSTLPVSLADVLYHTRCVAAGCARALVIADLPFGSYQASPEAAYTASVLAMQAGAQMVKLEGGAWLAPTVQFPDDARRSRLRPRRLAAAVGARARRLPRPGQDAGCRHCVGGGRPRAGGRRRRDARRGMRAERGRRDARARRWRAGHRHRRRAPPVPARCW